MPNLLYGGNQAWIEALWSAVNAAKKRCSDFKTAEFLALISGGMADAAGGIDAQGNTGYSRQASSSTKATRSTSAMGGESRPRVSRPPGISSAVRIPATRSRPPTP
jgi:hypothetical protein